VDLHTVVEAFMYYLI